MWGSCGEFKVKGFDEAKAHLKKIADGIWVADRRCPESRSEGMVVRRFKCEDKKAGKVYTARLIDLSKGDFRMQRGNVEDIPQEEPASEPASEPPSDAEQDVQDDAKEDTAHQPGPSSRRGADAPAKRSAAAPQTQPEVPSGGKRPRSNKQRKS